MYNLDQLISAFVTKNNNTNNSNEALKSHNKKSFPPADHEQIIKECAWYRLQIFEGAATCDEPNWYAGASITGHCANGRKIFHAYSSKHPDYSNKEASKKLKRAIEEANPRTCE